MTAVAAASGVTMCTESRLLRSYAQTDSVCQPSVKMGPCVSWVRRRRAVAVTYAERSCVTVRPPESATDVSWNRVRRDATTARCAAPESSALSAYSLRGRDTAAKESARVRSVSSSKPAHEYSFAIVISGANASPPCNDAGRFDSHTTKASATTRDRCTSFRVPLLPEASACTRPCSRDSSRS